MTTPLIHTATPNDAPDLARLRWRHKLEDTSAPLSESEYDFLSRSEPWFRRRLADSTWLVHTASLAERPGELVGALYLQHIEKIPSPGGPSAPIGYVTGFYVVPELRGRGVGAALLESVNAYASGTGTVDTLIVWPSTRASGLYERYGYTTPAELLEHEY